MTNRDGHARALALPIAPHPRTAGRRDFDHDRIFLHWKNQPLFFSQIGTWVPADLRFADFVRDTLPRAFGAHPCFALIRWNRARWAVDKRPLDPDPARTLRENAITHGALLSLDTPGIDMWLGASRLTEVSTDLARLLRETRRRRIAPGSAPAPPRES